jgi:eukaryotic-like serine/threonine-protein kinase
VTVPIDWDRAVADDGWHPPGEKAEYPALSVGTDAGWNDDLGAQGVFVGILPGTELPARVPGHPECAAAQEPVNGDGTGREAATVLYTGCGDGVMVERVVQLTDNRLLWVQVRSATTATANQVLDSVETHGFS